MARILSASMLAEIQLGKLSPIILMEAVFNSGGSPSDEYLRMWTGLGTLTWDSKSWYGIGTIISISAIRETGDAIASGFSATLNGQSSSNISRALQSCRSGASGKVWLGALSAAGTVIADPYQSAQGRLDQAKVSDAGSVSKIIITYESRFASLRRANERRFTHEDQQIDFPGDLALQYVPSMQEAVMPWEP